jgi:hypothetical protein
MIVLDASVVVELLTNGPLADSIGRDLAGRSGPFIVPLCRVRDYAARIRTKWFEALGI